MVIDATQGPDDIAAAVQGLVFKRLPRYRLIRKPKS
jgi:hypothetical protein